MKKSDVRGFYNTLYEERMLKPATIDAVHTVLHQVLEIAVEDGYIRGNPSDRALSELKRLYLENGIKKMALTQIQQKTLMDYLEKPGQYHHWYPLITTLLFTGMRIGEAAGLTWDDVDFEKETIQVNKTLVYFCSRKEKQNMDI